ncbi:MAG: hypothetical protein GY863_07515, partial [bacterium]|nr:hypothetical protein [bacterium]
MYRIYFVLIVILMSVFPVNAQDAGDFIDIKGMEKSGYDWEIKNCTITDNSGHMRLYQGHWLMYFLHWRPLTKEIENINPAYVRHQLLNFWGPNMAYFK